MATVNPMRQLPRTVLPISPSLATYSYKKQHQMTTAPTKMLENLLRNMQLLYTGHKLHCLFELNEKTD
jgi:hypothetical protein